MIEWLDQGGNLHKTSLKQQSSTFRYLDKFVM